MPKYKVTIVERFSRRGIVQIPAFSKEGAEKLASSLRPEDVTWSELEDDGDVTYWAEEVEEDNET